MKFRLIHERQNKMNIVNRGFLTIRPKQAFLAWANQLDEQIRFEETDDIEGTNFLIEEDFFEIEPVIEKHFKKIFKHELSMVTELEDFWPQSLTMETFLEWFSVDFGSIVIDLEKSNLKSEKI